MRLLGFLLRSPTLRMATLNLFAGGAFMLANLLLARELQPRHFAMIALLVAVLDISTQIGPLGLTVLTVRRGLRPQLPLLRRAALHTATVAALAILLMRFLYEVEDRLLPPLFLAILFCSLAVLAAAHHTAEERFSVAFFISQGVNYLLLAAALGALLGWLEDPTRVLWLIAGGEALLVAAVWPRLLRAPPDRADGSLAAPFPWRECFNLTGITASVMLHQQFERLVIPALLTLEDLAQYAALAVFAIAPFRVLQQAIMRTFMARVRNQRSAAARRRLLALELVLVVVLSAGLSVIVWHVATYWVGTLLGGRYSFPPLLVLSVLVMAQLRTVLSIFHGAVGALASSRQLALWNLIGWLTAGMALLIAWLLSGWGLIGVVAAVIFVTLVRILSSLPILYDRLTAPHAAGRGVAEEAERAGVGKERERAAT